MLPLEVSKTRFGLYSSQFPLNKICSTFKKTCVFSSFASYLYYAREHVAEKYISSRLESSFKIESLGYLDRINFVNKIIPYSVREEGDQHICYKVIKQKKVDEFDLLNDIRDHVMLVQLINTSGNVNHVVSIILCWIYDSHYKIALTLIK